MSRSSGCSRRPHARPSSGPSPAWATGRAAATLAGTTRSRTSLASTTTGSGSMKARSFRGTARCERRSCVSSTWHPLGVHTLSCKRDFRCESTTRCGISPTQARSGGCGSSGSSSTWRSMREPPRRRRLSGGVCSRRRSPQSPPDPPLSSRCWWRSSTTPERVPIPRRSSSNSRHAGSA